MYKNFKNRSFKNSKSSIKKDSYIQPSIWQVTKKLAADGDNSDLWKSELLNEYIKSVELLRFASKSLHDTLPKQYLEHVRIMLSKDNRAWILVVKEPIFATRLKMLADSLEEKILENFNYSTNIKVVINPDRWLYCGVALVKNVVVEEGILDSNEADDFLAKFIASPIY